MLDSNRKTIDPCLTRFRHKKFYLKSFCPNISLKNQIEETEIQKTVFSFSNEL